MKTYVPLGVRNRTLLTAWGLLESYFVQVPGSDVYIRKGLDTSEGFACTFCHELADRKRVRDMLEAEIRAGKYTQEFFDRIDERDKAAVQAIKAFFGDNLSKHSNEELIRQYDIFYQIYMVTLHPMMIAIYASDLQDLFEGELMDALGAAATQEAMLEHSAFLLTPTRFTTVQKEEQVLFELQDGFERSGAPKTREALETYASQPEVVARLKDLEASYGWFHMEYIGEVRTAAEYRVQLWERIYDVEQSGADWSAQKSARDRLDDVTDRQREFFETHPEAAFLKELTFAMQEFLIVLDYTKADLIEGIYYARPLLSELSKRVGLDSWIDVRYLLPGELKHLLRNDGKADCVQVADRMKRFSLLIEEGGIKTYFGDEATRIRNDLMETQQAEDINEFVGVTAYPGFVRGIACVVTGAQDREKFKQGNIMVTRDTTTELTSIIKMASAIVADNGGLLSHVSIVSREFKIPCLVLTKIATKAVKDGDEIEVDASNGIVRILKHSV